MRRVRQAWAWWGHINNAQALVATLGAGAVAVIALLGGKDAPMGPVDLFWQVLASLGVSALVLIALLTVARWAGWHPPVDEPPVPLPRAVPPEVIRAGQEALREKELGEMRLQAIKKVLAESKAEREQALAKAPHLTWSGVSVVPYRQGYEVRVACSNVGPTVAFVKEQTRVEAIASQAQLTGPADEHGEPIVIPAAEVSEPIAFFDFSVPGDIKPVGQGYAPFTLRMRCPKRSSLHDRTVRWQIVYKDDDDKMGFVSECSAIIDSVMGSLSVGTVILDQSSREARNDAYNAMATRDAL